MPQPYAAKDIRWLVDTVNSLRPAAKDINEVFGVLAAEWPKLTGRMVKLSALRSLYYKHNDVAEPAALPATPPAADKAAEVSEYKPLALTPGCIVISFHKATGAATRHSTMKEAVAALNGNANEFVLYEARALRAAYRSILVVER